MDSPTTQLKSQSTDSLQETTAEALIQDGAVRLELESGESAGTQRGYSLLVRGDVQSSSILSTAETDETITLLENDTTLVSGTLGTGTVGFVLDGEVVAAEFDDAEPQIKLNGSYVDRARWPTVKEYMGFGGGQDPVDDPFPESGELGGARNDPLNPEEYVIELDATDLESPEAYCFDIDGDVLDRSGGATVTDKGDRVYGCLRPGNSAAITIQGAVTRIETADGIGFSIGAR